LVGRINKDQRLEVQVHLQMRNEALAEAELRAISDPRNPQYGQFLSDQAFNERYAPTVEDVSAVRAHLEKSGLIVDYIPSNLAYVLASGPATAVERAFATRLGLYAVEGKIRRAAIETPTLPADVQSRVSTVLGLAEPKVATSHLITSPNEGSRLPRAASAPTYNCSLYFGQNQDHPAIPFPEHPTLPTRLCEGYVPPQLRAAYGISDSVRAGNDGSGVTVAIVDPFAHDTLFSDAQAYAARHDGDFPLKTEQFTVVQGPGTPKTQVGWYAEQALDIEAVHAMAPGANIVYVAAASDSEQDLLAATTLVVERRLGTIQPFSWGVGFEKNAASQDPWHSLATQAGLKGIGYYMSTGDHGDRTQGSPDPVPYAPILEIPNNMDNIVAVGATALGLGAAGEQLFEVGWETQFSILTSTPTDGGTAQSWQSQFLFGSAGGTSLIYAQPDWQRDIVPPAMAMTPNGPGRVIPDISMVGDPYTGILIGRTDYDQKSPTYKLYIEETAGGTSESTPAFGGMMALAEQRAHHSLGFTAPLLYQIARGPAIRDIAPVSPREAFGYKSSKGTDFVVLFDYDGQSIKTAPGFDNVTGLGVPVGETFLDAVAHTNTALSRRR
jgi:subtilase family serine protease